MSRHSKNNTAHSIFTQGEKDKLKEWGTIKARIGKDSQKEFNQCTLCLSKVVDPVACDKGHIFCRDCIYENLIIQKKAKERQLKQWELDQKEVSKTEEENKQKEFEKKVEIFEKNEHAIKPLGPKDLTQYDTKPTTHEDQERKRALDILIKQKDTPFNRNNAKKEWIQTSFWVPENTPTAEKNKTLKPDMSLVCPSNVSEDHKVKVKKLISLKLDLNDNQYQCYICKKTLLHQKIATLKSCGHTMCLLQACIKKYCLEDRRCSKCGISIKRPKDIIELQESGTSYSAHSQVETSIYKPMFNC